jgi:putative transcriptional regulator
MKIPNKRLEKLRKTAKLSQQQLAEKIGVSQSMIARIEAGERDPCTDIKIKLATLFNVSVEWLFYELLYDHQTCSAESTGTEGR